MIIDNFKSSEIDAIISCWNKALPHDPVSKVHFIKKLVFDVNFDPKGFFTVKDGDEILGFVNAIYRKVPVTGYSDLEPENGWISAFAVADKSRFAEIGGMLLDKAENYLLSHGRKNIDTGYSPVYFYQGVSKEHCPEYVELFKSRGYSPAESLARDLTLSNYVPPENLEQRKKKLEDEGFYVGPMKDEYIYSLIDPNESFNGSIASHEFKLRLSDFDYDRIRIAAKDGRIIGVALFGDPMGSPERFGPFVVSSAYRGKGLGSVLLHDCLNEMKKRGLHNAWMQWTPSSGTAFEMYNKLGFAVSKTYVRFSKKF